MKLHYKLLWVVLAVSILLLACGQGGQGAQSSKLVVWGLWLTDSTEPWVKVSNDYLLGLEKRGVIGYHTEDEIGYDGEIKFFIDTATNSGAQLIVGDAFGEDENWRKKAAENAAAHAADPERVPLVYFLVGSGMPAVQPNLATFDNELQHVGYLAGVAAGATTKSRIIGIVAAKDNPEPNRNCWGFIQGVRVVCPNCTILNTYIGSWFDPATAQEAAQAQIEQGADVLYAERDGVIAAAKLNPGVAVIGNLLNQNDECPDCVLGSMVWSMKATIDEAVAQAKVGTFRGIYYGQWSWLTNGGSEFVINESGPMTPKVRALVEENREALMKGAISVLNIEAKVPGRVILGVDF